MQNFGHGAALFGVGFVGGVVEDYEKEVQVFQRWKKLIDKEAEHHSL